MALFGKTEEPRTTSTTTAPVATRREETRVQRSGGEVLETLIGKGSEFDGKLTFEGQVHIEGKFTGQIHTKDTLIVGQSAKVSAEISAGTVIVKGVVEGNIKAVQLIELHASGRIKGNVETPALSIERGGTFEGTSKMENLSKGSSAPAAPVEAAKK